MSQENSPRGSLSLRTLAMPADTNPAGDVFGGWVLAQMDIAGGIEARARAKGRVATVAVDGMIFHMPVFVGDVVCCYADIVKTGRTSITVHIETWVTRDGTSDRIKVTAGEFTYVHIGEDRRPTPLPDSAKTAG